MAKSGDVCPFCKIGRLVVASSVACGPTQLRYLKCDRRKHGCRHTAQQSVQLSESTIRRRVHFNE